MTVAQVMNQTSGSPDYIGLLEDEGYEYTDRTTPEQALANVSELEFEPGERFDYDEDTRGYTVAVSCNTDTQDSGAIAEELEGIWT